MSKYVCGIIGKAVQKKKSQPLVHQCCLVTT